MKGYQVDIGPRNDDEASTFPLKIHVGIGVGTLLRVHVGDSEPESTGAEWRRPLPRREFFVAGPAVVSAGEMEGAAARGEVAVAPVARGALSKILGDDVNLISIQADGPAIISELNNLALLQRILQAAYVLRHPKWEDLGRGVEAVLSENPKFGSREFMRVMTYIDESLALYLSNAYDAAQFVSTSSRLDGSPQDNAFVARTVGVNQLRHVSVVFIRFHGLSVASMDDEQTLSLTQKIFMIVVAVLRRFNGCLRQFACDDKAASALAVFGLSGFAHERGEEVAAMRAAWAIRGKLNEVIGGKLYGIVGNENRADATCLGATVNLAARFMTHPLSAGQVLCDEITRDKCASAFAFEDLGTLQLKGFSPTLVSTPDLFFNVLFYTIMPELRRTNCDDVDDLHEAVPQNVAVLVASAIIKGLNRFATFSDHRFAIIVDDLQWIDATSLEILREMIAKCPDLLTIVVSRPVEEINPTVRACYNEIIDSANTVKINLNPLDKDSSAKLVKRAMGSFIEAGVKFAEDAYENIFALAQVMAQFDSISIKLQGVLKVAAVAGQYFHLRDVAAVLSKLEGNQYDFESLARLIKAQDFISFVNFMDESMESCSFAHYLVHQGIMQSLLPTFLEMVHQLFADHYESMLTEENRQGTIPLLLHHLAKLPGERDRLRRHLQSAFLMAASTSRVVEVNICEIPGVINAFKGFQYYEALKNLVRLHTHAGPRTARNQVAMAPDLEGLHQLLQTFAALAGLANYVAIQSKDPLVTLFTLLLGAVLAIVTNEEPLIPLAISTSVTLLLFPTYLLAPPLCKALRRRIPLVTMTDGEIVALRGPPLTLATKFLVGRMLWTALTFDVEGSRRSADAIIMRYRSLISSRSEQGRMDRTFALIIKFFLGDFKDIRKFLEEFLENFGEDDVGAMAHSDNIIELCACLIQQGDFTVVSDLYQKAEPSAPIRQVKV
ncbi:hypothetical protein HK101_009780 [Irineochytrium annulatum]|nr:hypothetical protein HK101_009780 [Irineochytrium annulatum]